MDTARQNEYACYALMHTAGATPGNMVAFSGQLAHLSNSGPKQSPQAELQPVRIAYSRTSKQRKARSAIRTPCQVLGSCALEPALGVKTHGTFSNIRVHIPLDTVLDEMSDTLKDTPVRMSGVREVDMMSGT